MFAQKVYNKMQLKNLLKVNFSGKKVLVRVDFNVPLTSDGKVSDDTRIRAHISTIQDLLKQGAIVSLCSHLGRPKGEKNLKYTLAPVAEALAKLTGWKVKFVPDIIGEVVDNVVANQAKDEILLLENSRFYKEEEKNDIEFAKKIAKNFDAFVMDAFSASHRAHATTRALSDLLPSCSGNLIDREITMMSEARDNPKKPFVLILGGAKVSDKIAVVENMLDKVDTMLIGGGMAFTFLKAQGKEIGKSLCETEKLNFAKEMLERAKSKGVKIILPTDAVVAKEFSNDSPSSVVSVDAMPQDMMGLDVGPQTQEIFAKEILAAKTVMWNGPMGVFEMPSFAEGSKAVAVALTKATKNGALTVIGGGDSAAAIAKFGFSKEVSHVSTGGGASLEFFEGKMLPGIEPFIL